jgi:hypothetical protein
MNSLRLQKFGNINQSMVTSLFRKDSNTAFAEDKMLYEASNKPAFNFGNISSVNSRSNVRVQPKLQINQPGDQYEQEADAMADKVMRMSDNEVAKSSYKNSEVTVQRKCAECEKEDEEKKIQRKENSSSTRSFVPTIVHDVLNSSSGKSMDNSTRSFMESRFNHDFSNVKIHDNNLAAESAGSINSLAYTFENHIVFNNDRYSPNTESGKRLLAHELTHVIQQSGMAPKSPLNTLIASTQFSFNQAPNVVASNIIFNSGIQTISGSNEHKLLRMTDEELAAKAEFKPSGGRSGGGGASGSFDSEPTDDALLRCMLIAPLLLWPFVCFRDENKMVNNKNVSPAPAPGITPPSGLPPTPAAALPTAAATKKLNFYHGSRWSIAKQIPKNVKPIGGGDFAAGFYTHHDADDSKALGRAIKWGRMLASKKPPEPYAGVVRFGVAESDYRQLFIGGKAKVFDLKKLDQPDFKAKQKIWLDFITSTGRFDKPVFKAKRQQWVHERREPQPNLSFNIVEGPFYTPLKGTKDKMPGPEEFKPYAEGTQLPQQITWANEGIKLLNSNKVDTELKQFDTKTGKPQDPPIDTATPVTTQIDGKQLIELNEEAQFSMGL